MLWRRSIVAPSAVVYGLIALSAWALVGGCGAPSFMRGRDGGASGGGTGDATGGSADASGGMPGAGSGGEPAMTGGTGTAGGAGVTSSGGRPATGGGPATGGRGSTGGTMATGTGGGMGGSVGGAVGGMIASNGGATATGGRGTGGADTGGTGSGGRGTGGSNTGGADTGGASTGGASTGGANTGGANMGGTNSGGAATGGTGMGGATAPGGALLYYAFDETTGPTVADQSGNSANGTISGGGTFGAGMIRNGLTFLGGTTTATSTYVTIPVGLLTSTRDMTISLWVKVTTDNTWQRVLDFGKTTTTGYMFLTTHAASQNVVRFAITATGSNAEQRIDVPLLPLGTWKHLALVFSATSVSFFVDGVKAATSSGVTLRPADLGALTNQWLGRSTFANDPYFAGQLDELRIYGRALSDAEVGVLYNLR